MTSFTFLKTYAEWRHCIQNSCKIPLTADFIEARLQILVNLESDETKRFVGLYGREHHQAIVEWFHKAKQDLKA